jgi:uncharacterized membrane protein YcaP (DUF421 family)
VFQIDLSTVLGIVARVSIVYVALLLMLRLSGRRTMSDVTPMDIMVMLLVSETVSPSLTAGDETLTGGLAAAATLILLSVASSWLAFRSQRAEALLSGRTAALIKDGQVDAAVMRRFRITDEDLRMALHQNGVLSVGEVRCGFVEADGEITIIKKKPD